MRPFHFAFKIKDIDSTRDFYVNILGCKEGRSTEKWIDFDFFGNQLSAQKSMEANNLEFIVKPQTRYENKKGEQRTMFILDFSGNPIEFKAFKNEDEMFV